MTKSLRNGDFPDSFNIEDVFFDEQKKERSPFEANLCCIERTTCKKVFSVLTFHSLIIFVVVLFSTGFLTFSSKTNYQSEVLALLSTCIRYIIPGAKALTKKLLPFFIPFCRSLARVDVAKLNWSLEYSSIERSFSNPARENFVLL